MKWKLVPVDVVTGEMVAAGILTPVENTGDDDVDRPEDYKQVFLSMLEAAPNPPKLSDERILEICGFRPESAAEIGADIVRKRWLEIGRAIEREILGRSECTS